MESPESKKNLNCAGCLNDIGDDDYVSALDQDWHKECFRCSVCDGQLATWFLEKAGMLFCQRDYWERFGDTCQQCAQVITGPVMAAGEHRFHPECFACGRCGAHIEDSQPYALLQRQQLYCGACACLTRPLRAPRPGLGPADLSRAQWRGAALCRKLAALARGLLRAARAMCEQVTCERVAGGCGLLAQPHDPGLENNGASVRHTALDHIEKVLARSDAVLQLTIEHKPEDNVPGPSPPEPSPSAPEPSPSSPEPSPSASEPHSGPRETEDSEEGGKRERLFKRKVDAGRGRVIKRRQAPASPLLKDKEKSSSMSKLLDVVDDGGAGAGDAGDGVRRDLARARSFRGARPAPAQTVFRPADLIQGELLGAGFFGEVYKVTHRASGELMVLKQLYRVDDLAQRSFLKEVAVLRSLQHPNVLRFIGVLYRDKRLHLVTEYVCGGTLHDLLQDASLPLGWSFRGRLARDVACGVGYLHRMNVIHRDLNSHNCLVREDKTVIVADFGLARIVERTASSTLDRRAGGGPGGGSLRRKRYTVVGNPYWMAPEMINGHVYDEKVDVFSFGIMLCEIIGRVSADPDFLPRRNDFGLNEPEFIDKFCLGSDCPEPLYRVAFLACHLDPDRRPPFEVLEIWLETLVMHLSKATPLPPSLLADVIQYGAANHAPSTECCRSPPDCCRAGHEDCRSVDGCCRIRRSPSKVASVDLTSAEGIVKSMSNAAMLEWCGLGRGRALGKCVSASHITPARGPAPAPGRLPARGALSRSQNALAHTPAGYILRADGQRLNITKVDDITEWLDPPPPLKRASQVHNIAETEDKTLEEALPAFLRNQSVEGLESKSKCEETATLPFCRHFSIPDNCPDKEDSDSSDEDGAEICDWYNHVSTFKKLDKMDVDPAKNILAGIAKKGEALLGKKSYDVAEVHLRNQASANERKIAEADCRRYNIDHLKKDSLIADSIAKHFDAQDKPAERSNFFSKKLLSPKLSRLFKPHDATGNKQSDENKEEKSKSKFFVQRPASPGAICRSSYRVRPVDCNERDNRKNHKDSNVIKSDLKLASMGKPMTPIFRRHIPHATESADGRFSYRDKRYKRDGRADAEPKFADLSRITIPANEGRTRQAPLVRSSPNNNLPALATVLEKDREKSRTPEAKDARRREPGISRSNYVSLANLKINGKPKGVKQPRDQLDDHSPVERVI